MCQDNISQAGCRRGNTCFFRHVELAQKPNKKSKKDGACNIEGIGTDEVRVPRSSSAEVYSEERKTKGTHARKEWFHSEVLFRSVRSLCAPKICGNVGSVHFAARAVRPRSRVEPGKTFFSRKPLLKQKNLLCCKK